MTTADPAYQLSHIRHYYGSIKVLDIPDLKIEKGLITGLIGPNGSGKSTLLKLLAFAQKPSEGQIFYKGLPEVPFSPTVRSKVTLLTQKPYLLKRSVFDNIVYGLKIRKDNKNIETRVKSALMDVGLDYKKFAPRFWHELSGGEAQRVAMAARLILKPEILLLDEPVASVDIKSARLIREASLKARDVWGTTLVIASHDLQWLYSISDRQASIFNGTIFPTGLENIITGPFETPKSSPEKQIKHLGDGQIMVLKAPVKKTDTAILRKKNIAIELDRQPGNGSLNQLTGHIVSLLLENKSRHIMATVLINDISFITRLTSDQISRQSLFPGKKVILTFSSDAVEWIQ